MLKILNLIYIYKLIKFLYIINSIAKLSIKLIEKLFLSEKNHN